MGTFLNVDRLRNNYEKVWVLFEDVEMEIEKWNKCNKENEKTPKYRIKKGNCNKQLKLIITFLLLNVPII